MFNTVVYGLRATAQGKAMAISSRVAIVSGSLNGNETLSEVDLLRPLDARRNS